MKMAELDRPYTTSYHSAVVSIALSCTIFKLLDLEKCQRLSKEHQC